MTLVRRSMKWMLALFLMLSASLAAAQTVIHTTNNYPTSGGQYGVDLAASNVIINWAQNGGGTLATNNQYTVIWNNAVSETYNMSYTSGGWLATAVPGTKRNLIQNVTQGPPISNCGSNGGNTFSYYITTIWYVVETGQIVDTISSMVTLTLDNPNPNGNC